MQMLPAKLSDRARQNLPQIYASGKKTIGSMVDLAALMEYQAQALAMETYAKKINDGQMHATAFRLRVRAIRRVGEILSKVKGKSGRPKKVIGGESYPNFNPRKELTNSAKLSPNQIKMAVRFAAIPHKIFDEMVDDESLPTMEVLERCGKNFMVKAGQKAKRTKLAEEHIEENEFPKVDVLYLDPPWRYEHPAMGSGDRSIENHYPTLTLDEICNLRVGKDQVSVAQLLADDCVCYMWTTVPKLPEAFEVLTAWGLVYRTQAIWDKVNIGMGYYFRNQHEILLVAKRGNLPTPSPSNRPPSIYKEKRTKHSAKPLHYYKMLEQMYPGKDIVKMELFARSQRENWHSWGFEADGAPMVNDDEPIKEAAE